MLLQIERVDMFEIIQPILTVFILLILMLIMVIIYIKIKNLLVIIVIFLFSLIIGMTSLTIEAIPFTPYIQIFFMLFQMSIFIITSTEMYKQRFKK